MWAPPFTDKRAPAGGIIKPEKQDAEQRAHNFYKTMRKTISNLYVSVFKGQHDREKVENTGRGCPDGARGKVKEGYYKKKRLNERIKQLGI